MDNENKAAIPGIIAVSSKYEKRPVPCRRVVSSQKYKGGKRSPQYALFGVNSDVPCVWGNFNTFLGWYADKESIDKEMDEIQKAISRGLQNYELKYNVKVERKWFSLRIVKEHSCNSEIMSIE